MSISEQLSRTLSYILRHHPEEFNVSLTARGWADLDTVLTNIQSEFSEEITKNVVITMMNETKKNRFELDESENKILALYGHNENLDITIESTTNTTLPKTLYHGTPTRNMESIRKIGLQPQSRSKVHLTDDKSTAITVAERHLQSHESSITLIELSVTELQQNGYTINNPSENIYTISKLTADEFRSTTEITI